MSDTLTILRVSLIPSLELAIAEEAKHLNYLRNVSPVSINQFILRSEKALENLKVRLEEYKKYLVENTHEQEDSARISKERT